MKILSITQKTLLEYLREPMLPALLFAFPVLLLVFYYIAFGETDQGLAKYLAVIVINQDEGSVEANGERRLAGEALIDTLKAAEFEGTPVFNITLMEDRRRAEITLRERKAAMAVIIPPDFTQTLLDASNTATSLPPTIVTLYGDTNSTNFTFAQSFINGLVREFVHQELDAPETATIIYDFVPGTGTMSDFDFGVPGLIIFGLTLLVISTAQTLVRENETGTLRRLRLTAARPAELLLGVSLAQMVLAALLIPFTLIIAEWMGFESRGSLPAACLIGLLFCLSVIGLGLITAAFARTDSEAANLGSAIGVVMVLLSGAMFPMPDLPLFTLGGRTVQATDFLPPAPAGEAMRRILVPGDDISAVSYELGVLTILSLAFLLAGIVFYGRLRMRQS